MLIVEDGSGLPNANAYVNIAWVEEYLVGDHLQAFTALTELKKEAVIIVATRYIDGVYPWKGKRKTLEQSLSWPRVEVVIEGFTITGVPSAVMRAVAEAVSLSIDNPDGLFNADNDRIVVAEKVDTLSQTYLYGKQAGKETITKFEVLDKVLKGLYRLDTNSSSVGCSKVVRV
ncbi:MAG: hypothetical protein LBF78_16035 [Treponema sp.]|nr:hypothetical protein [Treponema sp.]